MYVWGYSLRWANIIPRGKWKCITEQLLHMYDSELRPRLSRNMQIITIKKYRKCKVNN